MTSLFGFFVALAISVKQKDSSAVKIKAIFCLGAHLTNDSAALQLKARGRASLNSTWTDSGHHGALSVWFSILLESRATSKRRSSFALAVLS